jgi:hypothetical protein
MTDTSWLQAAKERAEAATEGLKFVEWGFYCPWCGKLSDSNEHLPDCGRDVLLEAARTDLPLALRLLAQAAEALARLEEDYIKASPSLARFCLWCEKDGHDVTCPFDILSRIRAGDGGE